MLAGDALSLSPPASQTRLFKIFMLTPGQHPYHAHTISQPRFTPACASLQSLPVALSATTEYKHMESEELASTLEDVPDELIVLIFRLLAVNAVEDAAWSACAFVCTRWSRLIRANRTTFSISLRNFVPETLKTLQDRATIREYHRLGRALAAAEISEQPIRSFAIQYGAPHLAPARWSENLIARLARLLGGAAHSLIALELTGPEDRYGKAPASLDPVFSALLRERPKALQRLDLSRNAAVSGRVLSDFLKAVTAPPAAGEATQPSCQPLATPAHSHMAEQPHGLQPGHHQRQQPCAPREHPVGLRTLRLCGHSAGIDDWTLSHELAQAAPQLTELSLAHCDSLSAGAVAALVGSHCLRLASLDLSYLRLTRAALRTCLAPEALRRGLRSLALAGFTSLPADAFAEALCACEGLTAIDFSASLLSDAALRAAATSAPTHLSTLRQVRFTECSALTDSGVHELASCAGGALRMLALGGAFSPLGNASAASIAQRCAAPLRTLELRACRSLGLAGLEALASVGSHLAHLDLSDSPDLAEDALGAILRRTGPGCGARLRALILRSCATAVTDAILAGFLPRAHGLRTLDVAHCTALTDLSAIAIASGRARALRHLAHLDVNGCGRFTFARGQPALLRARAAAAAGATQMRLVHSFEDFEEEEASLADDEIAIGWPSSRPEGVVAAMLGRLEVA